MEIALARKVAPAIADGPMSLLQTRRLASRSVLAGLVFAAMSGWCLACGDKRYTKRWALPQDEVEAISMDSPDCVSVSEKFVDPLAEYILIWATDSASDSALQIRKEMKKAGSKMVKACGGGERKTMLILKLFILQAFNALMQVLPVIDIHLTDAAEKEIYGKLQPILEQIRVTLRANERTLDTCKEVSKTMSDKTKTMFDKYIEAVKGLSAGGVDPESIQESMQEAMAGQVKSLQMAYAKCDPSDHAQLEVFGDYYVNSLILSLKDTPPIVEEAFKEQLPEYLKALGFADVVEAGK